MFTSILILLLSIAVFILAWNGRIQTKINEELRKSLKINSENLTHVTKYFDKEIENAVGDAEREFAEKFKEVEKKFAFENQEILTNVKKIDSFQKTQHKRLRELEGEKIFNS